MSTLLSLPREIRDRIIFFLIESKRDAPEAPIDNDPNRVQLVDYTPLKAWQYGRGNVLYERDWNSNNMMSGLMRTNHQLCSEVKKALELYPAEIISYDLDIMFRKNEFMATWLRVPKIAAVVDTVRVQFRVFPCRYEEPVETKYPCYERNIWVGGDGSPPAITWMFYSLLERFVRVGAAGEQEVQKDQEQYKCLEVAVRNLLIDFVSPPDKSVLVREDAARMWWRLHRERGPIRRGRGLEDGPDLEDTDIVTYEKAIRPEWLAKQAQMEMDTLLALSYHTAHYGAEFYRCIGRISFSVDGEVTHEIDLASRLDGFCQSRESTPGFDEFSQKPLIYDQNWKDVTIRIRKERGLSVIS